MPEEKEKNNEQKEDKNGKQTDKPNMKDWDAVQENDSSDIVRFTKSKDPKEEDNN